MTAYKQKILQCDDPCFANKRKPGICDCLIAKPLDRNGKCKFQKPDREITKGKVYPWVKSFEFVES